MSALSLTELLRLLDVYDVLAEEIEGFPQSLSVADFARAQGSDELLSSLLIAALADRYSNQLGDAWPEVAQSLEWSLRDQVEGAKSGPWSEVLSRSELLLALWGPPGALIEYATEYRLLELHDEIGNAESLFLVLLYDERAWEGAPELLAAVSTLADAHIHVAKTLAWDLGRQIRDSDPALTFRATIQRDMLWHALDEVVGATFGDWATAFRKAVEERPWVEREFIIRRASQFTQHKDVDHVRTLIEEVVAGELRIFVDPSSDAFDILREAYRAVWEGHAWSQEHGRELNSN